MSDALTPFDPKPDVPTVYRLLSGAQVMNQPRIKWLVKGLIPSKGLGAIYGAPRSGKTFLLLDLAMAIATGADWFGRKTLKTPIVYFGLEWQGLGDRLQAWQVGKETTIPDNFKMVEVAPFDLNHDGDVDGLAQTVKDFAPGGAVTIIDTMARATAGTDENSAKDMGLIIRAADRLATLTNGIVLLVHHTGKTEANGLRGSSALLGALDSAVKVTGSKDTPRKFEIDKNKHGRDGEQYPFTLAQVVIGQDEDGDEVTSCVVQPQAASPIETDPLKGLGKNQITALMAIRAVLLSDDDKRATLGAAGVPDGIRSMKYTDALKTAASELAEDGTSTRANERAKEAIAGLTKSGRLQQSGGALQLHKAIIWVKP